jgi:hypothetical protein
MASFMATAAHVRMEEIIYEGNIVRWIVKPQPRMLHAQVDLYLDTIYCFVRLLLGNYCL